MAFVDFNRKFIAKKFDVVAVSVLYHCFCQRRSDVDRYSAQTAFMEDDLPHLKTILENFKIQTSKLDIDTASVHYEFLYQTIDNLKEKSILDTSYKVSLSRSFIPPNNEYQNYGIMAAIDHINALKDIMKNYPQFKSLPKIYGGGSYGGYLALMCAKIAPWYVDGVIDNSCAGLLPLHYIIGRDVQGYDHILETSNTILYGVLKTHWTRKDPSSPYYFADENYLIRALLNKDHLILQSQKNKDISIISYHSKEDPSTPAEYKIQMCEILKA
ncbi:DUF2920 family protein, partial [Campylobacter volucris]|uniref:DUF2920 family protein n=1 Tax=Campylobacter volucris TaxID=1031542 RepID=UPI001FB85A19